jgi:hypothetical protein
MKPAALCSLIVLALLASSASAQMTPTRRTTSDGRPLASSLPPAGGAKRPQLTPIPFEQLNHHIGDRVEVTSIYGQRREGRVDSVSGGTLRLKTSAGLGYAVTNFERSNIRSIISME